MPFFSLKIGTVPSVKIIWVEHETEQLATISCDRSLIITNDEDLNKTNDNLLEDMHQMDDVFMILSTYIRKKLLRTMMRTIKMTALLIRMLQYRWSGVSMRPKGVVGLILPIDQSSTNLLDAHHRISLKK